MQALTEQGTQAGAFGLSMDRTTLGELLEGGGDRHWRSLCPLRRRFEHIRDESDYTDGLVAAVDEVITVSRGSCRASSPASRHSGPRLRLSDTSSSASNRREQGVQVCADRYPYRHRGRGSSAHSCRGGHSSERCGSRADR
jgi:hypothetical protein